MCWTGSGLPGGHGWVSGAAMSSVHSPRWHRVATLKPRLSPQLRLQRQRVRGDTWYLLANPARGRLVRLNPAAWALAGRFDGRRTMQELWERSLERGADAATQDEVIDLMAQLREAALLQLDRAADFDLLLPHLDQLAKPRGRRNLLAWRVPLFNPARLLHRLRPIGKLLFSRPMLLAWGLALLLLVLLAVQNGPALWAYAQIWIATPRFALLAVALYVPIKLLHELAHGMAVTRWGGQVREAGVTLMLLMPVPYVDASAASGFVQRRHRVVVSAAGIMAELGLATVALTAWLWLPDGWLRDAAFATLMITAVSTLLFNANPLQRLDGYYIATDALQLPNLGPRSRSWWLLTLRRVLLRAPGLEDMPVARGETPWLFLYAPLAWLYGLVIVGLAVAWLGQLSLVLGLASGALLAWQMLLRPLARLLGQLRQAALAQAGSTGRWRRLVVAGTVLLLVLLLLPWPQRMLVQGVVWPPDQAQLRSDEDGVVQEVLALDGQAVLAGDVVLQLANPALQSSLARQSAHVAVLESGLVDALPQGGLQAGDRRAELAAAQSALDRLRERVEGLAVRARAAGRLVLPAGTDLGGQYLRRGTLIGQVLTGAPPTVRVVLPEAQAGELQRARGQVSVRLAASPGTEHPASVTRDSIGAGLQLPSAALSQRHGGTVLTDPRDASDLKPLQPVVVLDVRLDAATAVPGAALGERVGERAWVRIDGGWAPLSVQWASGLRQAVLQRFNPQF